MTIYLHVSYEVLWLYSS